MCIGHCIMQRALVSIRIRGFSMAAPSAERAAFAWCRFRRAGSRLDRVCNALYPLQRMRAASPCSQWRIGCMLLMFVATQRLSGPFCSVPLLGCHTRIVRDVRLVRPKPSWETILDDEWKTP